MLQWPSHQGIFKLVCDLNAIYRSAQHLLTLTNDVIDLARVGMGRLAIVREPVDLRAIVDDACEIVRAYVEIDKLNQAVRKGARQLSNNDMWIAATAKASNASLLTADQDFIHLHPHYLIVEYIDPASKLPVASSGTQPKIQ